MSLPLSRVDTRDRKAFIDRVPPGKDTKTALDAIEKAWRAKHKGLRGLVYKPDPADPKAKSGIVPESSWYRWKTGESEPPFGELARIARMVGCDLRLSETGVIDGTSVVRVTTHTGGVKLKRETQDVVRMMERVPDQLREAIKDAVLEMVAEHANPPDAGEPNHPGPSTRSK